jgi:membrane protein YdbS with pleckstrin-like domain
MKKSTSFNFEGSYKVRTHIVIVIRKIIIPEIILAFTAFLVNSFVSDFAINSNMVFYIDFFLLIINIVIFLCLLLSWNYKYYIISAKSIASNAGVILRRSKQIDVPAIRSVSVNQGFFGRIFGYGTLKLESPLLPEPFLLYDLPNPFRHSDLIEKAILEAVNKAGAENVIIGTKPEQPAKII